MAGWQKISMLTVIIAVQQYRCSKSKMQIVLEGSLTLSGHQKIGRGRAMLVQCSLISPHIHPSHAKIHHGLSDARIIEDHNLEK